jgi:hypothetical protein
LLFREASETRSRFELEMVALGVALVIAGAGSGLSALRLARGEHVDE